ncbi:MAG: hypothetical protein KGL63_13620 [Betaproteobacteria bacterium]|nr:hypothetical protein [Betaproteobacteria bacterium]
MIDTKNIDTEARIVLQSQDASGWIKIALASALERDPVDAVNDAEFLSFLLSRRLNANMPDKHATEHLYAKCHDLVFTSGVPLEEIYRVLYRLIGDAEDKEEEIQQEEDRQTFEEMDAELQRELQADYASDPEYEETTIIGYADDQSLWSNVCTFARRIFSRNQADPKTVVDRLILEKALDFLISIEPDPEEMAKTCAEKGLDEREYYNKIQQLHEHDIKVAKAVLRQYAEQIVPRNREEMQRHFYSITNSKKYRRSQLVLSVTYASLNREWRGINEWQP